eukprot:maker-scaffold_20-snap-gene-0.41-mRNA-1 protein AED:0.18 eAED:0.18 QI:81/1/1/1/1/1/2/861/284
MFKPRKIKKPKAIKSNAQKRLEEQEKARKKEEQQKATREEEVDEKQAQNVSERPSIPAEAPRPLPVLPVGQQDEKPKDDNKSVPSSSSEEKSEAEPQVLPISFSDHLQSELRKQENNPEKKLDPLTAPFLPSNVVNDSKVLERIRSLCLFQLPKTLPDSLVKPVESLENFDELEALGLEETAKADYFKVADGLNSFKKNKYASGKIGKIKVYKSGKVKLFLNGVAFDLSAGLTVDFREEAARLNEREISTLGMVLGRVQAIPDLEALLKVGKTKPKIAVNEDFI